MNFDQHSVLKYIYQQIEAPASDLLNAMVRKHNDHRDFYPLAALILDGYVGFTAAPSDLSFNAGKPTTHQAAYDLSRMLQCFSQGKPPQHYQNMHIISGIEGSTFFIAAKGLMYFHEYNERRREWWCVALLGLASAVIAGCVTGLLVGGS